MGLASVRRFKRPVRFSRKPLSQRFFRGVKEGTARSSTSEWTFLSTRRVEPVNKSPRTVTSGSFTQGTYPHHGPYSLIACLTPATFANRLPRPTRPPLSRSPGFHRASGNIRLSDCSPCILSHFASRLIGSVIPAPPGNTTSPPGVTSRSSVPCRSQTPWYDGWVRTPSPS